MRPHGRGGVLRDRGDMFNRLLSTTSGAVGGLAGIGGAMLELPVTITLLLRAIMDIAAEHGRDPDAIRPGARRCMSLPRQVPVRG